MLFAFYAFALTWGTMNADVGGDIPLMVYFSRVLGERVQKIFGSEVVLRHADVIADANEVGLRLGCSNYEDGAVLAKRSRVQRAGNSTLAPILIDIDQDLMCFLIVASSHHQQGELSLISHPLVPALKLHDNLYTLLEQPFNPLISIPREALSCDLVAYFRPEAFAISESVVDPTDVQSHFWAAFGHMSLYDISSLDSFFWSSPETGKFLDNAIGTLPGVEADYLRYKSWSIWRSKFDDLMQLIFDLGTARSYGDPSSDPCGFVSLFKAVDFDQSFLKIPLHPLSDIEDPVLQRCCLANLAAMLAGDFAVNFVSVDTKPVLLNYRARSIPQSGGVGPDLTLQPYTQAGLRGDQQVVAIADTGLDVYNCYFYDPQGRAQPSDISKPSFDLSYRKVVQYSYNGCGDQSDGEGGHGTHVAGIAVGSVAGKDITTDGKYDGVAPNARVSIADLGVPGSGLCIPSVSQLYGAGRLAGARVYSNSWGTYFTGSGYYSGQEIDNYLYTTMDAVIFFAAGNAGTARTVTRESSAKNVVSVGSEETTLGSSDINYVAFYSSYGPTYDNRIKPDLVATGDSLNSAKASGTSQPTCGTIEMTGTSMASPAAAGNALLVRQYFQDTSGAFWTSVCRSTYRSCRAFTPSGVLVKATLAHSGSPMTLFHGGGSADIPLGPPPDFVQGFGRIALFNALPLKTLTTKFDLFVADMVNIMEKSAVRFTVQVNSASVALRLTLGWYDAPNVQGTTTKALLNDLDLVLVSPANTTIFPNRRLKPDRVNNLERIVIPSPSTGIWKVIVRCDALPVSGNQLFALVITGASQVRYA